MSPRDRFTEMSLTVKEFRDRARKIGAKFIILVYGSASYGFRRSQHGDLDDIDLIWIVPRWSVPTELMSLAKQVFNTDLDIGPEELSELLSGKWEMCRMYGENNGIRLGFRILCSDTFNLLRSSSGSTSTVRNVAKFGQSRIVVDVEWSIKHWRYVPIELEHNVISGNTNDMLLVNHHVFSDEIGRLGALGRKLLSSSIVYDPFKDAEHTLDAIWKIYISRCLEVHPDLKADEIIDSIMRSERFSHTFRSRLVCLIEKITLSIRST